MKHLSILTLIVIMTFGLVNSSLGIDIQNKTKVYLFEDYQEHKGVLELSENKKYIQLVTASKDPATIRLEFMYDDYEDLVIDDMGQVAVSGYYSRVHRVLFVEDILTTDDKML